MTNGQPLIPAAQSQDWTTPEPPLPFIYAVLGPPVDLDPASNPQSIVEAKRAIWWEKRRDPELELPPGVEWGDGLEILRNVEPGTTVYLNPPFGRAELPQWVEACVIAYERGAEIIALLPSYTSAYWFDHVYLTAQKLCFWGLPGETTSRLRFSDSAHGAGYACMFAYWGPNPERFVRTWSEAGQIWHLDRDRLLTAIVSGHRISPMPGPDLPTGLFAHAERRARVARYEALLAACSDVMDRTLGDLMASDAEALKQQFGELTIGEILSGLNLAAAAEVADRPVRRARVAQRHRVLPGQTAAQSQLDLNPPIRRTSDQIEEFDDSVLQVIESSGERGASRNEITNALSSTASSVRESLKRLRKKGLIRLMGNKRTARYHVKKAQEGLPDAEEKE